MFFVSWVAANRVSPADPGIGCMAIPGAVSDEDAKEKGKVILERDYPYTRGWQVELSVFQQTYVWEKEVEAAG